MDVGFRAHQGHALLKAESAVGGARVHGVNGRRRKGSVGSVQVELGTRTFLQKEHIDIVSMSLSVKLMTNSVFFQKISLEEDKEGKLVGS